MTFAPLEPGTRYTLVPEGGLRAASAADRAGLTGSQWRALQRGLDDVASYTATLRACAPVATELKPQLRALLAMRNLLRDLKSNLLDNATFRHELERILKDDALSDDLRAELAALAPQENR